MTSAFCIAAPTKSSSLLLHVLRRSSVVRRMLRKRDQATLTPLAYGPPGPRARAGLAATGEAYGWLGSGRDDQREGAAEPDRVRKFGAKRLQRDRCADQRRIQGNHQQRVEAPRPVDGGGLQDERGQRVDP